MPLLRSVEVPLRATLLMDAPLGAVRRALRRTDVWTRTVRALGARGDVARSGRPAAPVGYHARLEAGDLLRVRRDGGSAVWPARPLILRVEANRDPDADPAALLPSLHLLAGPLRRCDIALTAIATGAGTMVTVDVRIRASPAVLTPVLRRRVLVAAQLLLGVTLLAAREVQLVVAAAVLDGGRVLIARRTAPKELAGRWEFPGGKVNPGETERAALRRELDEELGLSATIGERLGPEVDLGDNLLLRCYLARGRGGATRPNEHDAIRWVDRDGVDSVPWVEPDREFLPALRRVMAAGERPISPG